MRARKRFGQHFLEPAWVAKLLTVIAPHAGETFFEIGPGHGALTRSLCDRAGRVVAFEIDRDLAAELRSRAPATLTIVQGDFLEADFDEVRSLTDERVRVVGNLPFNIASPILFMLAEWYARGMPIADATVMLQREVVERLVAQPGSRDYGVLTVLVRQWADVTQLLTLPPGAFRPMPKVRSAVVRLRFHQPSEPPENQAVFESLVRAIFTRRRKTLANALLAFDLTGRAEAGRYGRHVGRDGILEALAAAGIDGRRRPETLELSEFVRLADAIGRLPENR